MASSCSRVFARSTTMVPMFIVGVRSEKLCGQPSGETGKPTKNFLNKLDRCGKDECVANHFQIIPNTAVGGDSKRYASFLFLRCRALRATAECIGRIVFFLNVLGREAEEVNVIRLGWPLRFSVGFQG